MTTCNKCGVDVEKASFVPSLKTMVCAQCAREVESFPFTDEELARDTNDMRASIRIPISIGIHFKTERIRYACRTTL